MIDIHSHVLPGMDDGSRTVEESIVLLQKMQQQGVSMVAATPHFYAIKSTPDTFFAQRALAVKQLNQADSLPPVDLRLGAEVYYFEGVSRFERVREFCLQGTSLLLLEMPFMPWNARMLREIYDLNALPDVTVLLAHIDRYLSFQKASTWKELEENGVLFQANAEFFTERKTRRKALHLLSKGNIAFIGSDCHRSDERVPNLDAAKAVMEKHFGRRGTARFFRGEEELLRTLRLPGERSREEL